MSATTDDQEFSKAVGSASVETSAAPIHSIRLRELLGLYTYDLPPSGHFGRTPILYGENGLGKTNILRILFHLLSPHGNRGHRTALSKIRFREAEVQLSNGIIVKAIRSGSSLEGAFRLEMHKIGQQDTLIAAWGWVPMSQRTGEQPNLFANIDPELVQKIAAQPSAKARTRGFQSALYELLKEKSDPREGEAAFLKAIKENVPPVYFLTSDRVLISDGVDREESVAIGPGTRHLRPEELITMGRARALDEAIGLASRHLQRLGVAATQKGSRSMHSIYHDLLKRLASRGARVTKSKSKSFTSLIERITELSSRFDLYAKYGLTAPLEGAALVALLEKVRPNERSVAAEVLKPYVESLNEQAASYAEAFTAVDTFVSTVNAFLFEKRVSFAIADGMRISNRLAQPLRPSDLSSGEQQLLLLFCHITLATHSGGIFIIDEPEISLNVKWQRRLVDALERLDLAKRLQFILASHSMEILTRHRSSVVALEPR